MRRRREWVEALVWLQVVGVCAVLLSGGAVARITHGSLVDRLMALAEAAGLIGGQLLCWQLLLVSRVPFVDATVGHPRAVAMHRRVGGVGLVLVAAHVAAMGVVALLSLPAPVTLVTLLPEWTNAVLQSVPDAALALVSVALLCLVGLTSWRRIRRRLPYEWWHGVHVVAYPAVLLALPHEFAGGSHLAQPGFLRGYWCAVWASTILALVWWRVVAPAVRGWRHGLRVHSVVDEGDELYSIWLSGPADWWERSGRQAWRAGRFARWRFAAPGLVMFAHPWSFSATPADNPGHLLRLTVRGVGDASRRLRRLRPGTRAWPEGPLGAMTLVPRRGRRMILGGAGVGIAPLLAMLREAVVERTFAPGELHVVWRVRTGASPSLWQEMCAWAELGGAEVHLLRGPRGSSDWAGAGEADDGRALLSRLIGADARETEARLCGPSAWVAAFRQALVRGGMRAESITSEEFRS